MGCIPTAMATRPCAPWRDACAEPFAPFGERRLTKRLDREGGCPDLPVMTQGLQTRDAASAPTRVPRRTQAERSSETRRILLETTIACLHTRGYAATTTLLVAEQAGLSRGAMLHQFPTRVDLMMFVVQSVFDDEVVIYDARLAAIPDAKERLYAFPQIVWEVLSRPSGVAVLEILQGSRSDPDLTVRLAPLQAEIEQNALSLLGALVRRRGRCVQDGYAPRRVGGARSVDRPGASPRPRGD
jgi:AcrR family transcriptional regulator